MLLSTPSSKIAPDNFVSWLITQNNARGTLYLTRVAKAYSRYLRSAPIKLEIALPLSKRDVYAVETVNDFDRLLDIFYSASNFRSVNECGHQTFSAALNAYRRYLVSLSGQVGREESDMAQATTVIGEPLSSSATDGKGTDPSSAFAQKHIREAFKEWLFALNSAWSNGTLNTLCSDALYLYNNKRGITLVAALTEANGIEKAHEVLNIYFTLNPRQTGTASTAAKGYIDTLKLFKEFIEEMFPNLLENKEIVDSSQFATLPEAVVSILKNDYPYGFSFDTTCVRLLSEKSRINIDSTIQQILKNLMFCRSDGVYFLIDAVTDAETREKIIKFSDVWIKSYGCFVVSELYALFLDELSDRAIRNLDDFETFYEFISRSKVRCVAYYGTRIARINNRGIKDLSSDIVAKIISVTHDEYGGTITEDDLYNRFPAFPIDVIANIIKENTEELVKIEINEITCYQTLDALGLSDEFSDTLAEVLEEIDEIGLIPNEEVLHAVLSMRLGVNFKTEYNIPDDRTYRRLIATYYKKAPKREWKRGVFAEVQD